ncbi:trypsin-like, partial [Rhopalosiphum padi]|uniref:trypsin-like n=1 Tax=Rhopalosiphum padi TaxID=40932 RepID=UPI00298E6441
MIKIILVLFLLFNVVKLEGNVSNYENKGLIANGQIYDVEKYPFVVILVIKIFLKSVATKAVCTGSLISQWFVLTAAHCTDNMTISDINIFRGNSHQQIQHIYQHDMFNPLTFRADICLLKLRKPFKNVDRYISVAGHPDDFSHGKSLDCVVIGFGITADIPQPDFIGYMTNASVTYGPTACQLSNRSNIVDTWKEYLCSKPDIHMVCPGDSGGPMICNGFLYGIASHGYNFKELNRDFECGSSEIQTRHLFVYAYKKWITNITTNTGNPLIPHNNLYFTTIMLVLYIV